LEISEEYFSDKYLRIIENHVIASSLMKKNHNL